MSSSSNTPTNFCCQNSSEPSRGPELQKGGQNQTKKKSKQTTTTTNNNPTTTNKTEALRAHSATSLHKSLTWFFFVCQKIAENLRQPEFEPEVVLAVSRTCIAALI